MTGDDDFNTALALGGSRSNKRRKILLTSLVQKFKTLLVGVEEEIFNIFHNPSFYGARGALQHPLKR